MSTISSGPFDAKVRPILGSIRSATVPAPAPQRSRPPLPFITISRQAGAGGRSLAYLLSERLNAINPADRPWETFDRELVEKAAADHQISTELIDSLENTSHTWLAEFFDGLSLRDRGNPSDLQIFHRVAATVRALAQAGRVVLVGCGAGFIAANMPGGIHIRLVARFEHRVITISRLMSLPLDQAAARVRDMDRNRIAFYKRFFPEKQLMAEEFAMTLNSSQLGEEQMVAAILPLAVHGS